MTMREAIPDRFRSSLVLKADHFSTIERGFWHDGDREIEAVLRRLDRVPAWARPIARHLARREARALARLPAGVGPDLLASGRDFVVRGWISGLPLHLAKPRGDAAFFRAAKKALIAMHRAGVVHNDLAKEPNWLRMADGRPRLTDFQLATVHGRRNLAFRIAAREDLRHLLKIKRRYCPEAMTPSEWRLVRQRSLPSRIWMASGKPMYNLITRGVFGWMDREGAGDAAQLREVEQRICRMDRVRAAAVTPFPTATGMRFYAFVEAAEGVTESAIRDAVRGAASLPVPEHVQLVARLPRTPDGAVHEEVLRLVAENQIELIDQITLDESAKTATAALIAGRLNRSDRRLRRR